jgi:hypothetical protein
MYFYINKTIGFIEAVVRRSGLQQNPQQGTTMQTWTATMAVVILRQSQSSQSTSTIRYDQ